MTPVRIPPMLRDQVEGQREVLGEGETVRQVLEDVTTRYPALRANLFEQGDLSPFVNVYVGRDDVRTLEGLDTRVGSSSVILLPAMAGGWRAWRNVARRRGAMLVPRQGRRERR